MQQEEKNQREALARQAIEAYIINLKTQRSTLNEMIRTVEDEITRVHRQYEAVGGTRPAWLIR